VRSIPTCFFFFQAEDGIRDVAVTGVQTCALPILAPVSPSPRKDGFWTGDSNRNTNEGFVAASVHGTRSHDRGIRGESTQSPAQYRLAAKASPVETELRKCPRLAPVLGSHCQR